MDRYRQHELPETVKRYKSYTDSFQEWLMKTAMQRNVESAVHIAEQAKKKKEGKGVYKISTEQQKILVDGIARSQEPLVDTSGLRDLEDAIRSRKEVAQFHKICDTQDDGHSFLVQLLDTAMSKLTGLVMSIPVRLKSQGLEDEASTFLVYRFNHDETDGSNDEDRPDEAQTAQTGNTPPHDDEKVQTSPQKKSTKAPLSQLETQLQRNFLALCFVYEFNRVRGIVRETWILYHKGSINIISAALVTDLAQSYLQQNVAALVEDLSSSECSPHTGLLELLQQLYVGLSVSGSSSKNNSAFLSLSDSALRHIFCMDAIDHLEAHLGHGSSIADDASASKDSKFPIEGFLRYFDAVRRKKLKLPIWDRLTEVIVQSADLSNEFLPFGLQLVLDVHEIVHQDHQRIFKDITNHGLDLAKLIRTHTDYEDQMWDIDKRPDCMSAGNVKFSNVYLTSLDSLLNWLQELLKVNTETDTSTGMITTEEFVTTHATLAGLSMWSFNKTYYGFSIAKVSWFVTSLAHLYNAALKVGGLEHYWADLDYIIEMHGPRRIFVGGVPQDPQDFYDRFLISTCTSSRVFAKDYKMPAKFLPLVAPEMRNKRGLMRHFPLEDVIRQYYGPDKDNDRWIRRHQVFNYLKQLSGNRPQISQIEEEVGTDVSDLQQLRATFSAMVKKMLPPKNKNRRNKSSRVRAPDFDQTDDTYATMFQAMRTELQAHELHSNFDYLAFYRRAYAAVLRIREKVLFDPTQQLARYGDIAEVQNPDNQYLLAELFRALKIKPKDTKIKTTGDEVSKDVVPLDQLKRIAGILKEVIQKEGNVELDRAKLRHNRDWDGLKASYAREEAGEVQYAPPVSEDQSLNPQAPIQQGGDGEQDRSLLTKRTLAAIKKASAYYPDITIDEELDSDLAHLRDLCGISTVGGQGEFRNELAHQQINGISGGPTVAFDPALVPNIPDYIPMYIQDEYLDSFANFSGHVQGAPNESHPHRFGETENPSGPWAKAEFTFTAPTSVKFESNLETGKVLNGFGTQPLTKPVYAPSKPHQAYVSDEADEADEIRGVETSAPTSHNKTGTDSNASPDHLEAA